MRGKHEPILFGLVIGLIAYFLAPSASAATDAAMRSPCHAPAAAEQDLAPAHPKAR